MVPIVQWTGVDWETESPSTRYLRKSSKELILKRFIVGKPDAGSLTGGLPEWLLWVLKGERARLAMWWDSLQASSCSCAAPRLSCGVRTQGWLSGTCPTIEARGFGSRQPPPCGCVTEFPFVLRWCSSHRINIKSFKRSLESMGHGVCVCAQVCWHVDMYGVLYSSIQQPELNETTSLPDNTFSLCVNPPHGRIWKWEYHQVMELFLGKFSFWS